MLVCVVGGILKRLIEFEGIYTLDQHAFYSCKDAMDLYNWYVRIGMALQMVGKCEGGGQFLQ